MLVSAKAIGLICTGVAAAWLIRNPSRLPEPFQSRRCQGVKWHWAFPHAAKNDIRSFLSMFTRAFGFPEKKQLSFEPADTFLGIYRSLYPYKWMPDALELETFASMLKKTYDISLADVWSEKLTLGKLFSLTQNKTGLE